MIKILPSITCRLPSSSHCQTPSTCLACRKARKCKGRACPNLLPAVWALPGGGSSAPENNINITRKNLRPLSLKL